MMPPPADVAREIEALKRAVLHHHAISTRFGVFALRRLVAYEGVNPRTGESVPVPARTVIDFAPSPAFLADLGAVDVPPMPDVTDADDTSTPAPVMTIACDAFYEHVRAQLTTARTVKYSGFGNFTLSRHRPPRFEFAASQVWKQEVRDAVRDDAHPGVETAHERDEANRV